MDSKRNIGNRNRLQRKQNPRRARLTRRTRRQIPRLNRNRLSRAQNNLNRNRIGQGINRRRRYNNFRRRNFRYRIIFVANLPYDIGSRRLRELFQEEGIITRANVVRGRMGSKGYGFVTFRNPRDAWRAIRKWNNSILGGRNIIVQYRKRRIIRNNRFGNQRRFNNNYQGFNQQRGFRRGYGGNFGNRGGFRPRGRRY